MDGLQMVEKVRNCGLECDFIVLSGYSEFAYAKKAIEYGVSSYLVKPIEQNDLSSEVRHLLSLWNEKSQTKERLNVLNQLSAEKTLQQLLLSEHDAGLFAQNKTMLAANLGMPWPVYQVVLLDDERRNLEQEEKDWISRKLKANYDEIGEGLTFTVGRFVGFVTKQDHRGNFEAEWMKEAKELFSLDLAVAMGPVVHDIQSISESYRAAEQWMKHKFKHGRKGRVIVPVEKPSQQRGFPDPTSFSIENFADKMTEIIEASNRQLVAALLAEAENAVLSQNQSEKQIKSSFTAAYISISKQLRPNEIRARNPLPLLSEIVAGIEGQSTLQNMFEYMTHVFQSLCEKEKPNATFSSILAFIHARYGDDIKLERIADLFNYNCSYLGKLFKSQTGESFNAHLERIRIDKARQLLAEGLKVYEIAELVGYANVNYFHMKFKKLVGESPSSYKDKINSNDSKNRRQNL